MAKIRIILLTLLTTLLLIGAVSKAANAFPVFGGACTGKAADSPACQSAKSDGGKKNRVTGPQNIIGVAANIIALVTGIAAVIMIIISGFKFVTAGGAAPGQRAGDPNAIKSARDTLTASIIGLIVVALAWTIIRFVSDKLIQ